MPNTLYFGDNLHVLRQYVKDESVDLVYLDPPFNSKSNYNVLFKSPTGSRSRAQIQAFEDTWSWGEEAELAYSEVLSSGTSASGILRSLKAFLGENDLMAYLAMMAIRLIELRRVLKDTGSLYLHCDPVASHYLKLLLDGIFGYENFRNEIVWKRTTAHSSSKKFSPIHDTILYYSKTKSRIWNGSRGEYAAEYLEKYYKYDDGDGRLYWRADLTGAGIRTGDSGKPWRGRDPSSINRHWAISQQAVEKLVGRDRAKALTAQEKLDLLDEDSRIYWPKGNGMPQWKKYRDELLGPSVGDLWDDIDRINPVGAERLGYQTQKPISLLERIIEASSSPGDVILDPFCGCGTAVHAAEKLKRNWIGIDITHIAIHIIEDRLRKYFPTISPRIVGRPTDLEGARDLARRDKHEFQSWAVWLTGGWPVGGVAKKGMDRGVDGEFYFKLDGSRDGRAIISVKGGQNLGPQMIRDLKGTRERENADIGIFVSLEQPTSEMKREAVTAGFAEFENGDLIPRIRIITVGEMLAGTASSRRPAMYDTVTAAVASRKAMRSAAPKHLPPEKLRREPQFKFSLDGGGAFKAAAEDAVPYVAGPPIHKTRQRKRPA